MRRPKAGRWRKAAAFSAAVHCILLFCAGYYMVAMETAVPEEELLEVELADVLAYAASGDAEAVRDGLTAAVSRPAGDEGDTSEARQEAERKYLSPAAGGEEVPFKKSVAHAPAAGGAVERDKAVKAGGGKEGGSLNGGRGADVPVKGGAVLPPGVLSKVKPVYPQAARRRGTEGTVYLRVKIMENGRAADVVVAVSSGDASLDEAAVQAIYKWRFVPAKDGAGSPIACYTKIPMVFRLNGA